MLWSVVLVVVIGVGGGDGPILDSGEREWASPGGALSLRQPDVPRPPAASPIEPVAGPRLVPRGPSVPPGVAGSVFATVLAVVAVASRRVGQAAPHLAATREALENRQAGVSSLDRVRAVTGVLAGLEAPVAADVVVGLSTYELAGWLDHDVPTAERGLSVASVASELNVDSLLRLLRAGQPAEVMAAIAAHAPPRRRAEVAFELWKTRQPGDGGWESINALVAAAGSRSVESLIAAWQDSGQLETQVGELTGRSRPWVNVGLEPLAGLVGSAIGFQDATLKAAVFATSAEALPVAPFRPAADEAVVLDQLTRLLRSDPAGVIGSLNHRVDIHGDATAGWVGAMIEADRFDGLDALLAQLLGGPDRLGWFTEPGIESGFPYPHAANLGFYVGAYHLAIDDIATDAADTVALIGTLFSIVTGLVPGPKGSKVKLPIGPLVDGHAAAVVDNLDAGARSLQQTLWNLAKPRTADGRLWNGAGTTEFQNSWEEVVVVR